MQQVPDIQEKDLAVPCGGHADFQRSAGAGIGLREQLSRPGFPEDRPAAPEILLEDVNFSGKDQSHGREKIAVIADKFVFPAGDAPGGQAGEDRGDFFPGDLVKERSSL